MFPASRRSCPVRTEHLLVVPAPDSLTRFQIPIERPEPGCFDRQLEVLLAGEKSRLRLAPLLLAIQMLEAEGHVERYLLEQLHLIGSEHAGLARIHGENPESRYADLNGEGGRRPPAAGASFVAPWEGVRIVQKIVADIRNSRAEGCSRRALPFRPFVGEHSNAARIVVAVAERRQRDQFHGRRVVPGDERHGKAADLDQNAGHLAQKFVARAAAHHCAIDRAGSDVEPAEALNLSLQFEIGHDCLVRRNRLSDYNGS